MLQGMYRPVKPLEVPASFVTVKLSRPLLHCSLDIVGLERSNRMTSVRPLYGQAPTGAKRMKRLRQKSSLRSFARAENICFVLLRLLHPVDLERYIAR
jgi:hypothetical protein